MTAFAHFSVASARLSKVHTTNVNPSSFVQRKWKTPKRRTPLRSNFRMESAEKENPDLPTEKPAEKENPDLPTDTPEPEADAEGDEDERLQRNPVYVYKEFAKVSAKAVLIGLVLFFYDILISLWVTTVGLLYALAVLFEVKGADTLFTNIRKSSVKLAFLFADGVVKGWNVLRTEVRKALKKWSHVRK